MVFKLKVKKNSKRDLLSFFKSVVCGKCDRNSVLEAVDEAVGHRRKGGEPRGQRHGRNVTEPSLESSEQIGLRDVKNRRGEERAIVKPVKKRRKMRTRYHRAKKKSSHVLNLEPIGERLDVHLLKEGGSSWCHLITLGNDLDVIQNLNVSLGNSGGDVKRLEKRSFSGLKSGKSSGNRDIAGRHDS